MMIVYKLQHRRLDSAIPELQHSLSSVDLASSTAMTLQSSTSDAVVIHSSLAYRYVPPGARVALQSDLAAVLNTTSRSRHDQGWLVNIACAVTEHAASNLTCCDARSLAL